jgi:Ca2+-transporting ATPase
VIILLSSVNKLSNKINNSYDKKGLSEKDVNAQRKIYGENVLEMSKKKSPILMFLQQFTDIMVIVLLAATIASGFMGEWIDSIVIISIVIVNGILGFIQEFRTEKTMELLRTMAAPTATVVRGGKKLEIPSKDIVPGDLIILESGDKIPADAILVEAINIQTDEAMLTGESIPVSKHISDNAEGNVFMGTLTVSGRGAAIVTATGMNTSMGQIADMIHEINDEQTPLGKKLTHLGRYIAVGCIVICAIVAGVGLIRGEALLDMLLSGISLAVAAVPEGLPAIVTISLALGVQRMLKKKALVKKLPSVETLGCAAVICTDKTGTLTQNKMTVTKIYSQGINVDLKSKQNEKYDLLNKIVTGMTLCNNSTREGEKVIGEPTETAIFEAVEMLGYNLFNIKERYSRIIEIPFDSDRKLMSVVCKDRNGGNWLFSKGAPDIILNKCKTICFNNEIAVLSEKQKVEVLNNQENMAKNGLRVLGFAFRKLDSINPKNELNEQNLVFTGLVAMMDPPRPEVIDAVKKCKAAGIRTIMITGDHKFTAEAIAKDIGIISQKSNYIDINYGIEKNGRWNLLKNNKYSLTGSEIDVMTESEFDKAIKEVSVFARVSPRHKLAIVKALKKQNNIVAMTGDGVNDAPAIKEADIGVAMGKMGTDVTREAASMVLLDDNFATIVAAVEEGRGIYSNIRKFIRYMLSCNLGEVFTMSVGMISGLPLPLLPIQVLWVNLVTDGLPAVALGLEPAEEDIMNNPPRNAKEGIFSKGLIGLILIRGCIIGISTLAVFISILKLSGDLEKARTAAFITLCTTQLIHVFECKSEKKNILQIPIFSNKWLVFSVLFSIAMIIPVIYIPALNVIFSTCPMDLKDWMIILGITFISPIFAAFFRKRY